MKDIDVYDQLAIGRKNTTEDNMEQSNDKELRSERFSEHNNYDTPVHNNYLLMYLLQNRADDFIRQFESQNHRCFMGIYSLYRVAFANKILLDDTQWVPDFLPIVENGRKENIRILNYLSSLIDVPNDFFKEFKTSLKPFAWFDEDDDYDWMLNESLEKLMEMGYREIDCELYAAGMKFNFSELEKLLADGGNPYIKISAFNPPHLASKMNLQIDDVFSLYDEAYTHACDCGSIYGVCDCWRDGFYGKETHITQELLHELFQGAGFQLVVETIRNNN